MTRHRHTIYLTDDEHAALKLAAAAAGTSVGQYVRSWMLLLAGYEQYSGPMFAPGTKYVDRCALFVTHELLRMTERLSLHVLEVLNTREIQLSITDGTEQVLIKLVHLISKYPQLPTLKLANKPWEMAYRLKGYGEAIAKRRPILGNTISEEAGKILEAIIPEPIATVQKRIPRPSARVGRKDKR